MKTLAVVVTLIILCAGCSAPARVHVDDEALAQVLAHAEGERPCCVVIEVDGRLLARRGEDEPMIAMSASKSIASLAVGFLVDDGVLTLDEPVATWVPQWRGTPHEAITIRHLMMHTSGLDPTRADLESGDIAAHGATSRLLFEPGSRFQYNNNAVDFLAVIMQRAGGAPLDDLLEERLFQPLGIDDATWLEDANGVPFAAGELTIRPTDLLKVGRMLVNGGVWEGRRIISRGWIGRSTAKSQSLMPSYGLLWWRDGEFRLAITADVLDQWRRADAPPEFLAAAEPLQGIPFDSYKDFRDLLVDRLGDDGFDAFVQWIRDHRDVPWAVQVETGQVHGYSARGWLGQFLVVIPESRTVAVRMCRPIETDFDGEPDDTSYLAFPADVRAITD